MKKSKKKIVISLSVKLIVPVTVLLVAGISVLSFYFLSHQKRILHEALRERGLALADNLAYNSDYGMLTANNSILSGFAEGILKQPDVRYCIIQNVEGKALVSMFNDAGLIIPQEISRNAHETQESIIQYFNVQGQDYYEISVPVTTGIRMPHESEELLFQEEQKMAQKGLGIARVGISLVRLDIFFQKTQKTIYAVGLTIISLAIIITILLARTVLGPIGKLVGATRAITEDNLDSNVDIQSHDEIGQLADSFNQMIERLKKTTVSKTYIDDIIQSMVDALIVSKPDGEITTVNKAAINLFEYSEDELIGNNIGLIFAEVENKQENIMAFVLQELRKKNSVVNYEANFRTKNNKIIPILLSGAVMREQSEKVSGIVIIVKDNTEQKKRETLSLINQQLKASEQKIKAAHEELAERMKEVEQLNDSMTGRELRIIEVKEEVNKLSIELGRPAPYNL